MRGGAVRRDCSDEHLYRALLVCVTTPIHHRYPLPRPVWSKPARARGMHCRWSRVGITAIHRRQRALHVAQELLIQGAAAGCD